MMPKYAKLLTVALFGVLITACNQVGPNASAPKSIPSKAEIDKKVAAVSQTLADECFILRTGFVVGQAFTKSEKVQAALEVGSQALNTFCANPPQDVNQAIAQVAQIAIQVNEAVRAAKKKA